MLQCTRTVQAVRIEDVSAQGGWIARSLTHGRKIWVKGESQLLYECDENGLKSIKCKKESSFRRAACKPPEALSEEMVIKPIIQEPVISWTPAPPRQMNLLDATEVVLRERRKAMTTREIVNIVLEKRIWTPSGPTPWATLHTAISREITSRGAGSRFKKCARGKFAIR
jgi:hypothetical protein